MARTIIKSNSTDRTKRQRQAFDANHPGSGFPKPRYNAPGNSRAGTETAKKSPNGMMAGPKKKAEVKKAVKKAVKKTATAAKKTVKKAVAAVKKTVRYDDSRGADAGRKQRIRTVRSR